MSWRTQSGQNSLANFLTQWDANHYKKIAELGYTSDLHNFNHYRIVYLPLYPLLVRIVSEITFTSTAIAGLITSNILSFFAYILTFLFTQKYFGHKTAWWTSLWLLFYPTSYFLNVSYTEGLFISLTMLSFMAIYDNRSKASTAFVLGFTLALTRISAMVFIPAVLFFKKTQNRLASVFLVDGIILGIGTYLFINYHLFNNIFAFVSFQKENWDRIGTYPWVGIYNLILRTNINHTASGLRIYVYYELGAIALILASALWALYKKHYQLAIFSFGMFILTTSYTVIISVPRYSLSVFPILIMLATFSQKVRILGIILLLLSLLIQFELTNRFIHALWAY